MKKPFYSFSIVSLLLFAGCSPSADEKAPEKSGPSTVTKPIKSFDDLVDFRNISLDSLRRIMAITKQPVILYFSGFADVNSRKLEEELFINAQENDPLDAQTIVMFMLDDRNPLPSTEKYISAFRHDSITSLGKRGIDIQITQFRRYDQPCFLKVDDNLKVLDSLTYIDRDRRTAFFGQ